MYRRPRPGQGGAFPRRLDFRFDFAELRAKGERREAGIMQRQGIAGELAEHLAGKRAHGRMERPPAVLGRARTVATPWR